MKYTEGPWSYYRNLPDNLDEQYRICGPISHKVGKQFTLAEVGGFTEDEAEANAHLISSAPELLKALKDTTEQLGLYLSSVEYGKDDNAESAYQYGLAMIAKAEWRDEK